MRIVYQIKNENMLFLILFFIIEHAVTVAFEIRICDLLAEFLAYTLCVIAYFTPAGAMPVFFL